MKILFLCGREVAYPLNQILLHSFRQFGAVEGGTAKNTTAIRSAMAKAASEGGGHILIPRGTWPTGVIRV